MTSESIEDYLETILIVTRTKKYAQVKDIANILGIKPPSVTGMFNRLMKEGYVSYKKYCGVTLTDKGFDVATKTIMKHNILKKFLTILGVTEKTADKDACRIEHVISEESLERIKKFIEFVAKSKENGSCKLLEFFDSKCKSGKFPKDPIN